MILSCYDYDAIQFICSIFCVVNAMARIARLVELADGRRWHVCRDGGLYNMPAY